MEVYKGTGQDVISFLLALRAFIDAASSLALVANLVMAQTGRAKLCEFTIGLFVGKLVRGQYR